MKKPTASLILVLVWEKHLCLCQGQHWLSFTLCIWLGRALAGSSVHTQVFVGYSQCSTCQCPPMGLHLQATGWGSFEFGVFFICFWHILFCSYRPGHVLSLALARIEIEIAALWQAQRLVWWSGLGTKLSHDAFCSPLVRLFMLRGREWEWWHLTCLSRNLILQRCCLFFFFS